MATKANRLQPSRLTAALLAAFVMPVAGAAFAQDANAQQDQDQTASKANTLDKVIVTGSLIPQTEIETFKPVTVISAEDLQNRGFASVQEALHESSFATGGVQGNQTSASFTQGAETNSLFGLNPGYTKYLIDGRPMANYPALYNGSDVFNNISGIPVALVERIEILPGGQSSLYGSDAIAGVVNIILKKKVDGTVLTGRYGWYDEGGGESVRGSVATSFGSEDGRFNMLLGAQFEKVDPIWGYQRDLTKQFNTEGTSAPVASRDWVVIRRSPSGYVFPDPANCGNVSDGFGGTVGVQTRPGLGSYCGSFFTPGYRTIKNGKESGQIYTHATFDVNDNVQLYGDLLYNDESTRYHIGSNYTWWGTSVKWGYFYDPKLGTLVNLQRAFAPEDMGGFERSMNRNDSSSYALTLGANGTIGDSNWDYDVGVTRTDYRLTENRFSRLADPINDYFQTHVLGPQLGLDPIFGAYPIFDANYGAFFSLMSPADFQSFTGYTRTRSKTYDNMLRAQVTNGSLFALPGGDAGLAVAVEAGNQGWDYAPDARLLNGEIWGSTAVSGGGSRTRYAVTSELRLPIWDPLTVSVSGRYDSYKAGGTTISKPTYSLGIEYRPLETLLLRGKYGTAFKSPTLSDQFQGESGFYSSTYDYLFCQQQGYDINNVSACYAAFGNEAAPQYFGVQSGNVNLKPINADVWSYGVVWAPTAKFSMGVDYHHWNIRNEVAQQDVDQLMKDEVNCTPVAQGGTGLLDPNSGTCRAAFDQIVRMPSGELDSIYVSKVNVAREVLNAVTFDLNYLQGLGSWGDLRFNGSWTRNLKHEQQTYPTDPVIDLTNNGYYSRDPNYRANASVAWSLDRLTTTLYANYIGPTGNYIAWSNPAGYNYPGGGRVSSYTTYNASVNYDLTSDLKLSFIVTNLFNKMPDMDVGSYNGLNGAPYNGDMFNPYGRAFYVEARWNFGKGQ